MPLPISHSLAGAAIYTVSDADGGFASWRRLVAAVIVANAPDLDLVPGVLIGDPNRFHHGWTHSFLTAGAIGVAVALLLTGAGWGWPLRARLPSVAGTALMVAALWSSHVLLDLLTHDPSLPVGVPALWPLSEARFNLLPLFARGDKIAGPATPLQFVTSILSDHNLRAAAHEALLLGPVLVAAHWWRKRRDRSSAGDC